MQIPHLVHVCITIRRGRRVYWWSRYEVDLRPQGQIYNFEVKLLPMACILYIFKHIENHCKDISDIIIIIWSLNKILMAIHVKFQDIPQIVLSTYIALSSFWTPFITPAPQSEIQLEGLFPLLLQTLKQSCEVSIFTSVVWLDSAFSLIFFRFPGEKCGQGASCMTMWLECLRTRSSNALEIRKHFKENVVEYNYLT